MRRSLFALLLCGIAATHVYGEWVNVTANLAGQPSACGNIYCLFAVPGQDKVIAGVCGNKGLFATTDNGASWQPLGTGSNWVDPQHILFDKDNSNAFWEIGIHGGTVHKTTDGGATFTELSMGNGDGIGVDMTDPERKTIVIGAHETTNVHKSTDGGATWTNITAGLSGFTSFPVVVDAQTYILGSNAGICRTVDGGASWTLVSSLVMNWNPLIASDGTVYAVTNSNQAIVKSTDDGASWTVVNKPGTNMWIACYSPIELPDGSIVAVGNNSLVRCADGSTWTTLVRSWPAGQGGLTQGMIAYNSVAGAFYMAFYNCNSVVPANAVWRYDTLITGSGGDTVGLQLNSLTADPAGIVNTQATTVTLSLTATDDNGTVTGVTIDHTELGGSASTAMAAQGDVYTASIVVPEGFEPGSKRVTATATDNDGNQRTRSLTIAVTGEVSYIPVYNDNLNPVLYTWAGDGQASPTTTIAEVSGDAPEGTRCYDIAYTVAGWWAGGGIIFGSAVDFTAYDSLIFSYKGPGSSLSVSVGLAFTDGTDTGNDGRQISSASTYTRIAIPLDYFSSYASKMNSVNGMNFIIGGVEGGVSGVFSFDDIQLAASHAEPSRTRLRGRVAALSPQLRVVARTDRSLTIQAPSAPNRLVRGFDLKGGVVGQVILDRRGMADMSLAGAGIYLVKLVGAEGVYRVSVR
jgi:hypothetical protein